MARPKETPKAFEDQLEGEEVLYVFRKHPIVMRKGLIISMSALLLGTVPALIEPTYAMLYGGLAGGFLLSALLFSPAWIAWYYSVFIITDERFIQITQKGLFHHSTVDLSLSQIQSINYEVRGFQETVLGYGTILVQTYMGDLVIHDLHHPGKIYRKMLTILRDQGITPTTPAQDMGTNEEENQEARR